MNTLISASVTPAGRTLGQAPPPSDAFAAAASLISTRAALDTDRKCFVIAGLEASSSAPEILLEIASTIRAQYGSNVLAVELDFRHPAFVRRFGLNPALTLDAAVAQRCSLQDAAIEISPGFSVIAASNETSAASGLLPGVRAIRAEFVADYDVILFAPPPFDESSDGLAISSLVSQVVLVIEAGRSSARSLERASARISGAGMELLGLVINQKQRVIPNWLVRRFKR